MVHIPGDVVAKIAVVLDIPASDEAEVHLYMGGGSTPLTDHEGNTLTLGDLRAMLRPFSLWFGG